MEPYRSGEWQRKSAKFPQVDWLQHHQVGAGLVWLSSQTGEHQDPVLLLLPPGSGNKLGLGGSTQGILPAGGDSLLLHIQLLNGANEVACREAEAIGEPKISKKK